MPVRAHASTSRATWIYVGGYFTKITGGPAATQRAPTATSVACVSRTVSPTARGGRRSTTDVWDIDANAGGDRVYVVGTFRTAERRDVAAAAARDHRHERPARRCPTCSRTEPDADTERMQTIMEIGDAVYQGGSQHILHKYAKSDYAFQRSHMTLRGGDFQTMAATGGILYASCHCNELDFSDTEHVVDADQLHEDRADQPDRCLRPEHPRLPPRLPAEHPVRRRRSVGGVHRHHGLPVGRRRRQPRLHGRRSTAGS